MRTFILAAFAIRLTMVTSAYHAEEAAAEPPSDFLQVQDIEWKPLNPARGKKGPQAGTLWGDQTKPGASGFLVKFVDGFSSPPHLHNITYRGIVISGGLHNDDPDARPMWMSAGSYWTQPAGEVHITSARGASVAYVEIEDGPYLVLPTEKAFDNGEKPVNVDASNLVWLDSSSTSWITQPSDSLAADGPKIAFLWGKARKGQMTGTLLKLPAGFAGKIAYDGPVFRAVIITGQVDCKVEGSESESSLAVGSYFGATQPIKCLLASAEETILYLRTNGDFELEASPVSK